MCIVKLECYLFVELLNIIMISHVLLDCFLYRCRYEEVLLLKSELFTCIMVIIGIKYLNDISCKVVLLNSLLVITLVK